jgi:molybdopterin-guanine dinucleotide biosynthesis protein A
MRRRFRNVSGFVLAGGASRRMGRPKHLLQFAGETLLSRQIRLLDAICGSVTILTSPESFLSISVPGFPAVEDGIPHCGPLGAIYAGLSITRTEYNLFLGCDLPLMEVRFLRYLCGRAVDLEADVTVPLCGPGDYQPLCAVYRRRARAVIRASILRGDYKVTRFFPRAVCQTIGLREMSEMGFGRRLFTNINTPADYNAVVSGKKLPANSP